MADNVLNEEELSWIQERAETINQLADSKFAGHMNMEDRGQYEQIAWKINGRSFPICWSCGGSLTQVGRLLRIKLK